MLVVELSVLMSWSNTAIGALDIDTTGVLTFNDALTAGSIALDGAADVDLATGAITLDTSLERCGNLCNCR